MECPQEIHLEEGEVADLQELLLGDFFLMDESADARIGIRSELRDLGDWDIRRALDVVYVFHILLWVHK